MRKLSGVRCGESAPHPPPCSFRCRLPDGDAELDWHGIRHGHALVVAEPVDVAVRVDVWHREPLQHALAVDHEV